MARKKSLDSYPKEYFELFRMANEKGVFITHDSNAQAEATRNELYTFRQVLYDEGNTEAQAVLADAAQNVRLSVRGSQLICEPIRIKKEQQKDADTES